MKFFANVFIFLVLSLMFGYWLMFLFQIDIFLGQTIFYPNNITGIDTLEIGLAGFCLGVVLLLSAYFWKGTKYLNSAIILMTGLVITGLISLFTKGFSVVIAVISGILLLNIAVCRWMLLKHPTPKDYLDEIHPDFKVFRFIYTNSKGRWRKKLINKVLDQKYSQANTAKDILTKTFEIKGYEDRPIKVEVFELENATNNSPCIIVYPGGAFWASRLPIYKYFFNRFIKATKAKIVFIHYTLALEASCPAAHEDSYLATLWAYENAQLLGIDNSKIVLYGISTGACLAAAMTLMLRDRGQFKPRFQMLIYPLLDVKMETRSAKKYIGMAGWKNGIVKDGLRTYLKDYKGSLSYIWPMEATDFSNLPEAYIEGAEYDCLRDDAEIYAERLNNAGTKAAYYEIKDAVHGFDLLLKNEIAIKQIQKRIDVLNEVFA